MTKRTQAMYDALARGESINDVAWLGLKPSERRDIGHKLLAENNQAIAWNSARSVKTHATNL